MTGDLSGSIGAYLAVGVGVLLVLLALRWAYSAPKRRLGRLAVGRRQRGESQGGSPNSQQDGELQRIGVENELRRTNFEMIAALLLILGVAFTYLQLQATRAQLTVNTETQASDRLVKTIGQIGSDKQAEQVGGMYGLRNLAVDAAAKGDQSYFEVLDQTLSAYVRQAVTCVDSCPVVPEGEGRSTYTVQVALSILGDSDGRLRAANLDGSRGSRMVDLRDVNLRGANLRGLYLTRVDFRGSNLSNADLADADLSNSDLRRVVLHEVLGRDTVRDENTRWP